MNKVKIWGLNPIDYLEDNLCLDKFTESQVDDIAWLLCKFYVDMVNEYDEDRVKFIKKILINKFESLNEKSEDVYAEEAAKELGWILSKNPVVFYNASTKEYFEIIKDLITR